MTDYRDGTYVGERALFATKDAHFTNCVFCDGESPLKESQNLIITYTTFKWKYPIWYCQNVDCQNITIEETARSGIWYTKNIKIFNSLIASPKTFRRAEKVFLNQCKLPNAQETFWNCKDIRLFNVEIKGDYLGFNSDGIEVENMVLNGNYAFDGGKNIVIRDSVLYTKDAFWNTENVTIINSKIIGEYFGWNSKNITLINCEVESHQGFCYIDGLKMVKCKLNNTDLCFEYCSNIDADIITSIDSVKNPYSGTIKAPEIKELILDKKFVDPNKTQIIIGEKYEEK